MRARGFTLLEALVALAVLGTVLSQVFGVFSSGLKQLSRGDDRLTLALIAESLLGRADLDLASTVGSTEGSMADGVRWRVSRQPFGDAELARGLEIEEPPPSVGPPDDPDLLGPDGREEESGLSDLDGEGDGRQSGLEALGDREEAEDGPRGGGLELGRDRDDAEEGGTPGRRSGSGSSAPLRLRAWLIRVEVANMRGDNLALSKLSLERAR